MHTHPSHLATALLAASGVAFSAATAQPALDGKTSPAATVYRGREGQTHVRPPRLDESGTAVDGELSEPQWKEAALLTGFSQFSPVDGVPAEDSTEVYVWYSATAIHFGVRAFEPHGAPRATLAARDRIDSDDNIQLLLGTFNDGRQAMVFGVNPLGVQMDGVLVETNTARANDFTTKAQSRDQADLSPDFVFESKGRLTTWGYEIELRIPFKSLKYPGAKEQIWGLNVVRLVQHSKHEDSWAPAKRATLSFLGQSGTLEGLTDLHRGLVVDITPEVTQRTAGTPSVDPSGARRWSYAAAHPQAGATVRWGVTNNMTLTATANPDFSQVESDAGQFVFDPRQTLFFEEKRPFFLEGSELLATPHALVYTRRIVQPVGAAKLTGKASGLNVALLSAVDRARDTPDGRVHPVFNILRLQRDLGGASRLGMTYTDRVAGTGYNRVADLDGRWVRGIYSLNGQYAQSWTGDGTVSPRAAPLWTGVASRNGKALGIRYSIEGVSDDFRTYSGYIGRGAIVAVVLDHRLTYTAAPGRFLETFSFSPVLVGRWRYQQFVHQGDAIEKLLHLNLNATMRGGWQTGFALLTETFGFDPAFYAGRRVLLGPGDTVPFRGVPRIPNQDWVLSLTTPEWQRFSANVLYLWGHDENFFEWASANIIYASYGVTVRPSQQMRLEGTYQIQSFKRRTDATYVGEFRIPRLKMEYQIARPLFVRLVGEYDSGVTDALRDDARTGKPILIGNALVPGSTSSTFRGDFLFSYQPVPGTVFFAGYGSSYADAGPEARPYSFPRSLGLAGYTRENDALFLKASYLFRL